MVEGTKGTALFSFRIKIKWFPTLGDGSRRILAQYPDQVE